MTQIYEYPDFVARFYDVIYHKLRSGTDTQYFLNKIKNTRGRVLEVGAGTGRFFAEALKAGADIYGIDISKSMTDILKTRIDAKEHFRVQTGDACTMKFKNKFQLIIAPFRVFSHLINVSDQMKFLDNIWEHLEKDGQFIFDLFVPNPELLHKGMNKVRDFEGEYEPGKKLRRIVSSYADNVSQLMDITMKFEWEENDQWLSREWQLKLRYYYRYELEHLIKLSKLNLVHIFGDYHEGLLNKESKEFIVVCSS
jgi:SAM-dependent methyltransferase